MISEKKLEELSQKWDNLILQIKKEKEELLITEYQAEEMIRQLLPTKVGGM
ncbi:MAG: hypothetical protein H7836_13750 [Magnetococcus sp. YQC-3]